MADFELNAELRTDMGKGASRRLRRIADLVPAILYGAAKDPLPLSIAHKDLHKACENEAFFSHIITIKADGKSQEAILKDLQRHPARDRIMHVDFMRIQMDQAITVEVPLHFINEDLCVGVKQSGGIISHNMTSLEITCLPGALPEYIEVDIADLDLGSAIHMSEITLTEGLAIQSLQLGPDHDHVVVSVHAPKRVEEIEEEVDAEVDGEAPEADASTEGEGSEGDE
ncbi:MAG: 50S ribosomal protein L25/general stress protein Ctc [Gammaproteobacteria bacterium]|jgi:large subunit ribosomal protein L25|nr:50S ribosomal protein L25/general stress protein Ctc [Gammaproteobacteria bacterium]MBT7372349.1 50S ribosomal protein L25/general stress protein Ctc [Gammaproteobacteria bacterium]